MSSLGKHFGLSSSLKEEMMMTKKQGIVSILGESDSDERTKSDDASSLRRTLSADLSSKKWLSQHGFFPLKKIPSSDDGFQIISSITDSSSSEELCDDHEEEEEKKEAEKQPGGHFDIWSSILSHKVQDDPKNLPPPYIHPLVKKSASSLSKNSLHICTESLGSESGSDGFSSYPPSETGDTEEDKEEEQQEEGNLQQQEKAAQKYDMDIDDDWQLAKYKFAAAATSSKKPSPKSFPPPIPSLSIQDGDASVHMRSRRDNGRLVVELVSVPSQNNFRAQRQNGRLVLTFINKTNGEEQVQQEREETTNEVDQFVLELDNSEDEEEQLDQEDDVEEELEEDTGKGGGGGGGGSGDGDQLRFVVEIAAPNLPSGVISFHWLALMVNKSVLLANRNPTWPKTLNKEVNFEEEEEEEEAVEATVKTITPLAQSFPPRPMVAQMITSPSKAVAGTATAASLNACEYYWKPKGIAAGEPASVLNAPLITQNPFSGRNINEQQQELLVWRGKNGDYLVPFLKGCKEARRSLLVWVPYCIATS